MATTLPSCLVCGAAVEQVYHSPGPNAVDSLGKLVKGKTTVFLCAACGHLQNTMPENIEAYYDTNYNILADHEEEDNLYAVINGERVFRTQHQAKVALEQVPLPKGVAVLEYGCGKALTLRHMMERRPDLDHYVFDVSRNYTNYWDQFVPKARQASYRIPASWHGRMDVVLSFFALEHTGDPVDFAKTVLTLLKPGGLAHLIVPNVYRNPGDMLVVDHVSHFSAPSLHRLLAAAGFEHVNIDDKVHEAAFIITAIRPKGTAKTAAAVDPAPVVARARELAASWNEIAKRMRAAKVAAKGQRTAIFGTAIYAMIIVAMLPDLDGIETFLDQNPFQQGKNLHGKPVIAPERLDPGIKHVFIGLNPVRAKTILANVEGFAPEKRQLHFL